MSPAKTKPEGNLETTQQNDKEESNKDEQKPAKLTDLQENGRSKGNCSACGDGTPTASIMVQVREGAKHHGSKTRSFCEDCAVKLYPELRDTLMTYTNRNN